VSNTDTYSVYEITDYAFDKIYGCAEGIRSTLELLQDSTQLSRGDCNEILVQVYRYNEQIRQALETVSGRVHKPRIQDIIPKIDTQRFMELIPEIKKSDEPR